MLKIKIASSYFPIIFMVVLVACDPVAKPTQPTTDIGNATPARTLVPVASSTVIRPTATPTIETQSQSPACTFPLAQTTTIVSTPEKYIFSQPSLVFTDKLQPDIVDWLPDSQNVIIMPMKLIDLGINGYQQTIELLNSQTRETQIYAIRRRGEGPPAWNAGLQAIVYPATKIIGTDVANVKFLSQVRISYGNPDQTQLLEDDLPAHSITLKPDGGEVLYLEGAAQHVYRFYGRGISAGSLGTKQSIPFDRGDYQVTYTPVWRPGTSQMFFHSYVSPTDQTFLLDVHTGQSCTLDLDGWVGFARWSPNGRYLAVIKSAHGDFSMSDDLDLNVLDALTGFLYKIDSKKVGPTELKNWGRHIIGDFSWAPDNHHLVVTGEAAGGPSTYIPIEKLYLVDFLSGDVDDLFPLYQFYSGWWGTSLAWSPDGSKLLASCPTEKQGRLCFMAIKRAAQP